MLKVNKLVSLIVMFAFLINIAFAVTTYEETSSVSRIVGENPGELLKQMQRETLDINRATYYSNDVANTNKQDLLKKQFGSNTNILVSSGYSFSTVTTAVNSIQKNELFLLESKGNADPLYAQAALFSSLYPKDVTAWQTKFGQTNPLFVFDAPYAGAYLPKEDSFVKYLVKDATIIAPTSFNSPQFMQSVLCNLFDQQTIGDVFKDARNFHYNGGSISSSNNLIGLVLQSYALYGNPRQKINMLGWKESDRDAIKNKYCKNDLDNLETGIEYLGQVGNYSKFRKYILFDIPSYNVPKIGNFSIINATNAYQNMQYGDLVLPIAVRTTHFPENTIFTNYSLISMLNPVDIQVTDLPTYEENFTNRICYIDTQNESIEFADSYTETNHDFIARISPVRIINCTSGNFRMYRTFNYSIDYITMSSALIKDINAPVAKKINEIINVSIEVMPLSNTKTNSTLVVFDQNNNRLWERVVTNDLAAYSAAFYAPAYEGLQKYSAELLVNNQTMHYKPFSVFITILEPRANIPMKVDANPTININLYSYLGQNYNLSGKYHLTRQSVVISEGNFTKAIIQGDNNQSFSFINLKREDQSYTLTLELEYLGQKNIISYLLTTNNVPLLNVPREIIVYENETAIINYTAIDYDNDALTMSISDSKFSKQGNSYVWKTGLGDNGSYTATITASDGLLQTSKKTFITVLPYVATQIINNTNQTCTPNWNCGSWNTCQPSNTQTRTCTDSNNCGVNTGKPSESQSCTYVPTISCPVIFRTNIINNNYVSGTFIGIRKSSTDNTTTNYGWCLGTGYDCTGSLYGKTTEGYDIRQVNINAGRIVICSGNTVMYMYDSVSGHAGCENPPSSPNSISPTEPYTSNKQEIYKSNSTGCPSLNKAAGSYCTVNTDCSSGTCTANTCTNTTCTPTSTYTPALSTFCGTKNVQNSCGATVSKTGTLTCTSPNTCTNNVCVSPTCTPNWSCGNWTACQPSNTQTRTCSDANNCGVNTGKPSVSQSCTYQVCTPNTNKTGCTVRGYPGTETCNAQGTAWNACNTTLKCGDGIKNGPEECEGDTISCNTADGKMGSKKCNAGCTYDACVAFPDNGYTSDGVVVLNPNPAFVGSTLSCSIPGSNPSLYIYQWYKNGAELGQGPVITSIEQDATYKCRMYVPPTPYTGTIYVGEASMKTTCGITSPGLKDCTPPPCGRLDVDMGVDCSHACGTQCARKCNPYNYDITCNKQP